jgi:hypothetical protein
VKRGVQEGAAVRTRRLVALLALLGPLGMLGACSHLHWPFHRKPPPQPEVAHELVVTAPDGTTAAPYPQYWKRNTVVVDLQGASGTGGIVLKPRPGGAGWPVRIALRMKPGAVGQLEVRADQRAIIPVTPSGTQPVDLELPPGLYTAKSEQITVQWGPANEPAA